MNYAELAFVIGQGGRYISGARAMDHVFGYTIINGVSARDFQMATSQWLMGKTFDTFAPAALYVTKDEVPVVTLEPGDVVATGYFRCRILSQAAALASAWR